MGYVTAQTSRIALATGSVITTLRHPLLVAKAAASIDRLSNQRLVLGIATGDRPTEFPAFGQTMDARATLFQEALTVLRQAWREDFPEISTPRVNLSGADTLPKPALRDIPVMVTGHSRQSVEWIAEHGDGWLYYPQNIAQQAMTIKNWRSLTPRFKPFTQSFYIDLSENPDEPPSPIFLGFRA
ncbi:LLM class flavin-dependent oxidoreductase, partial [Pseudomonas aeruginosa]